MANENLDLDDILPEESRLSGDDGDVFQEGEGFVVDARFEDLEDIEGYAGGEELEGFEDLEGFEGLTRSRRLAD